MNKRMESFLMGAQCVILALVLGISGCRTATPGDPVNQSEMAHAIHSEQLRAVMQSMQRLGLDDWPQELDAQEERDREQGRIRKRLEALAEAAAAIPLVLEDVDLTLEQQAQFAQLANDLRNEALDFSQSIGTLGSVDLRSRFDALQQRCYECHRRYRVLPRLMPASTSK